MKRNVKTLLVYGLVPVLMVLASIASGFLAPQRARLMVRDFYNVDARENAYFSLGYDDEREWPMIESTLFAKGYDTVTLGYHTEDDTEAMLVFLDDEGEKIGAVDFQISGAAREVDVPLEPQAEGFRIVYEDENMAFDYASIINHEGFNGFAGVTALVLCLMVYLVCLKVRTLWKKPEYGFLIVAAGVLILLFMWAPVEKDIIWDSEYHYPKTLGIAFFGQDKTLSEAFTAVRVSDVGHLPGIIGAWAVGLFTQEDAALLMAIRMANAMAYVAACFFAIKLAKRYRLIFAAAALVPSSLFIATSCGYDPMVTALSYLALALMVNELIDRSRLLRPGPLLAIMLCLMTVCMTKPVYAPICLPLLFLPKEKFKSRAQGIWFKVAVGLFVLCVAASFLLPALIDSGAVSDERGGDVNSAYQIAYILRNPLGYLKLLWANLSDNLAFHALRMTSNFGYLDVGSQSLSLCILLWLGYAALSDTAAQEELSARHWHQGLLGFSAVAVVMLIYISMFIVFTEVGAQTIMGVQSRYFLPLLPAIMATATPIAAKRQQDAPTPALPIFLSAILLNFWIIDQVVINCHWS